MTLNLHTPPAVNLKHIGLAIMVGALLALGVVAWSYLHSHSEPPTAPPNAVAVEAKPAPQLDHVGQIAIAPPKVKVFKPAAKAKLRLPEAVITDNAKHVIAAAVVRADDHQQTVTTVLDASTGESKTYVKEEPLPWLALDTHGEAGIYGGLKNGMAAARLEVRQGLFQVKAVHVGAIASLDQPLSGPIKADSFVGIGVWYRW